MLDVYKNIKKIRELKGMSQDELAKAVGFKSRSSINKIEQGVNDITQSKLVAIANALMVTPGELMGSVEAKEEHDLLEFLFSDNSRFLAKLKHIGMNGELDEPDIDASFSDGQRARLIDIISSTYHQAMQDAAIKAFSSDRPAGLSDDEWELVKNVRLEKSTATSSAFRSGKEA